jgi:hypothetical protein
MQTRSPEWYLPLSLIFNLYFRGSAESKLQVLLQIPRQETLSPATPFEKKGEINDFEANDFCVFIPLYS